MKLAEGTKTAVVVTTLLALSLALGALLSCRVSWHGLRQGWDEKSYGSLVPHETFPGDCSLCHVPDRWDKLRDDFVFDHEGETGVALEGAHDHASCLRCHNDRGPVKNYLERGCSGCHRDPHEATFGTGCESCHNQVTWRPQGLLAKHSATRFPLFGAHLATTCDSCHIQAKLGLFMGAPVECDRCHLDDLARSPRLDHMALGWDRGCERCHSPIAWNASAFAHNLFPLVGGHARADCDQCHPGGMFVGTPRNCDACHLPEYAAATNPGHQSANLPLDCSICHSTFGWMPAFFGHTRFPLTGRHAQLNCQDCHMGGVFLPLPTDCFSCHQTDYNTARNPDHVANGFPTMCQNCHTTSAWDPSTFAHDQYFPIASGAHSSFNCVDCHTGGNFNTFSCTNCHAQNETDHDHRGISGYTYSSPACLTCHPDGKS